MNLESHATVIAKNFVSYYGILVDKDEEQIELKLDSGEVCSFSLCDIICGAIDTVDLDEDGEVISFERL